VCVEKQEKAVKRRLERCGCGGDRRSAAARRRLGALGDLDVHMPIVDMQRHGLATFTGGTPILALTMTTPTGVLKKTKLDFVFDTEPDKRT
jgi:hypothetical protein